MLKFLIKGSTGTPYTVTADGVGASLRMYCTCMAGRKGTPFCRHRQAVLLGDITSLVQPSDDPMELKGRAMGSPYLDKAIAFNPSENLVERYGGVQSLSDVYDRYNNALMKIGIHCRLLQTPEPAPNEATEALFCYRLRKGGKILKHPDIWLERILEIGDHVVTDDGGVELKNIRPRKMPWRVSARGRAAQSWSSLAPALNQFLLLCGLA